ncbi:protein translocase subunit SecF [uncultured Friedmanniella sp.]|uniref:protein translocase subunit SecF n=1 Tax=uncultured Friedmanniella sp. TaxID=335381 RepID=UPI0035CB2AEC
MSRFGQLGHRLYTGEVSYDFISRRRRWYAISAILIVISLGALGIRGLQFGIEFKGGADFRATTTVNSQTVDNMQNALDRSGVPNLDDSTINTIGGTQVRVQTRTLDPTSEVPKVRAAIGAEAKVSSDQVTYSLIGASWGSQITERALIALLVFLVLVGLVIWAYFRNGTMAGAGLVALGHDLILTIGIYALVGFTVTPSTLIGVLTILGYSLYDTVVVFDKVRENTRDLRSSTSRTYSEAANLALNQVLVRSINTTVIGVLPVAALLFAGAFILGEGPLKDLALALFVGMVSGAYSSIFLATPLLAQLKERDPEMRKLATRVANRRAKESARGRGDVTAVNGATGGATDGVEDVLDSHPDDDPESDRGGHRGRVREGATALTVTRAAAGTVPVRPVSEGAAKRPQPQNKPRSQRRK